MPKGLRLYLTHKERQILKGVIFDEAETLREQLEYNEGDVKINYDLVCGIWNKLNE